MDQFEKEEAIRREVESETLRQSIRIMLKHGLKEEEILPEIMSHHSLSREKAEELLRLGRENSETE